AARLTVSRASTSAPREPAAELCVRRRSARRSNMTAEEIVEQLKPLGIDAYKKVLLNHGVKEPFFGVKIEDLKKIQKRVKKDYQLALDLYDTGIYDAMYLAGLIADDPKMTKKDLQRWLDKANCAMLSEYTVAWGSPSAVM